MLTWCSRQVSDRRLRPHLARHAQGRVLAHPGVRRLELPPGTRRPGRGGDEAESRNRRQAGGGRRELAAPIVQAGLVDAYRIVVAPTAVGGGTPFFPTLPSWISLRLLENRTFPGGTVLLQYEAKHD